MRQCAMNWQLLLSFLLALLEISPVLGASAAEFNLVTKNNVTTCEAVTSDFHVVEPAGLMFFSVMLVSLLLSWLRQSTIVAYIGVGLFAGAFSDELDVPEDLVHFLSELGIILVLFMAGLEVDVDNFLARWKIVLLNGLGMISVFFGIGLACGAGILGLTDGAELAYFSLCLTLSSTIVVIGAIKSKNMMESPQGQIILGIMVLQDITAVVSLSILESFDPDAQGSNIGMDIAYIFLKLVALVLICALLSKFLLTEVFRLYSGTGEMLFIASLGYCMGVAGLCSYVEFSAEIGAFCAGASLSRVPYKLEIEDKAESLKNFGVILFFVFLGFELDIPTDGLGLLILKSAACSIIVCLVTPLLMVGLAKTTKLKSGPGLAIGLFINQISEFSLVIGTLCVDFEVFSNDTFLVVTLTLIFTFMISSCGHQAMDWLYDKARPCLSCLDRTAAEEPEHQGFEYKHHIVLIACNELSLQIASFFGRMGVPCMLMDLDPDFGVASLTGKIPPKKCQCLMTQEEKDAWLKEDEEPVFGKELEESKSRTSRSLRGTMDVNKPPSQAIGVVPTAPVPLDKLETNTSKQSSEQVNINDGTDNGHRSSSPTVNNQANTVRVHDGAESEDDAIALVPAPPPPPPPPLGPEGETPVIDIKSKDSRSRESINRPSFRPDSLHYYGGEHHHGPDHQLDLANFTSSYIDKAKTLMAGLGQEDGLDLSLTHPVYADVHDPDCWVEYGFSEARMIISCMEVSVKAELGILQYLKEAGVDKEVPFIGTAGNIENTLRLYEAGARFVIRPAELASKTFRHVLEEEWARGYGKVFLGVGHEHNRRLKSIPKGTFVYSKS